MQQDVQTIQQIHCARASQAIQTDNFALQMRIAFSEADDVPKTTAAASLGAPHKLANCPQQQDNHSGAPDG